MSEYSTDPASSSDGSFIVYSGSDVGTTFPLRAVDLNGISHALPSVTMTRGARHLAFFHSGSTLLALHGEIQHKNLCLIDLPTGTERPLANFPAGFDVRDFDISPDGREVVLERVQEHSDIVLLDLKR